MAGRKPVGIAQSSAPRSNSDSSTGRLSSTGEVFGMPRIAQ